MTVRERHQGALFHEGLRKRESTIVERIHARAMLPAMTRSPSRAPARFCPEWASHRIRIGQCTR